MLILDASRGFLLCYYFRSVSSIWDIRWLLRWGMGDIGLFEEGEDGVWTVRPETGLRFGGLPDT